LFEGNEFELNGKRYRTDWARIIRAMTAVVTANKFGFKNHNYLKRVMVEEAERVSAEGLTAKEERERSEVGGQRLEAEDRKDEGMTAEEFKRRRGIESLSDMVGKEMA